MKMLCERFDIMSGGRWTESLEWMYSRSMVIAGTLVLRNTPAGSMAPRRMANGLFCLLMAQAGLLPPCALRPEGETDTRWNELFLESQCLGKLPKCALPRDHWD